MTKCREIRESLLDYREKELAPEQETLVEAHLSLCEACREELRATEEVLSAVAGLQAPDPWPGFSRRLHSRLEPRKWRRLAGWFPAPRLTLSWVGGCAALLVVIGVGFRLMLPLAKTTVSSQGPELGKPGASDVSLAALGEREVSQLIVLWSDPADRWEELADWPARKLASLALEKLEVSPEEVLRLWQTHTMGTSALERLVGLSSYTDPEVERFLDRVR